MNEKSLETYTGILKQEKITIVGGGLVGIVLAGFLAKENLNAEISVFDKLPDPREVILDEKRSINITLCERGLAPLRSIGISGDILNECMPVKGRMIHQTSGAYNEQSFGDHGECLYSVNRARLAQKLALAVNKKYPHVKFNFSHEMISVDFSNGQATFKNLKTDEIVKINANIILGADGINSRIRENLKTVLNLNETRYSHPQAYRELRIPAGPNGKYIMDPNYLHYWPRGEQVMIGFPNLDGSFTISLFYPKEISITPDNCAEYFKKHFPDIYDTIKDSVHESAHYPQGTLSTVRCFPWIYEGKAALIGDAAHAVFPFYGQGANAGFEDCFVLAQCYRENPGNWPVILENYQALRKPNADAISHLAEEQYHTLAKKLSDHAHLEKQKIAHIVAEKDLNHATLYHNIAFTQIPFSEARERNNTFMKRVDNIHQRLNENIERPVPEERDNFVFHDSIGLLFFASPRHQNNNPIPQQASPIPQANH